MKKKNEANLFFLITGVMLLIIFSVFYSMANIMLSNHNHYGVIALSFVFIILSSYLYRFGKQYGPQLLTYSILLLFTISTFLYVFITNLNHFSEFMIPKITFLCSLISFIIAVIVKRKYFKLYYSTIYMFISWIFSLLSYGSLALGL